MDALSRKMHDAIAKLHAATKPRDTRAAEMLLAGRYWNTDQSGVPEVGVPAMEST